MNDILFPSNDKIRLEEIKTKFSEIFEMSDLGKSKHFLGTTIE